MAALHEDWGAMMGRMHHAVPHYRNGQHDPRRHVGYEDDITRNCRRYLPNDPMHLADILADLLRYLQALPRGPGQFGLLHTDCHHGNFHVDGRKLTLFDFDDCCHTWFAYDLAVQLWHFPVPERGRDPARNRAVVTAFFRRFLAGYSRHHRFDPAWRDQLPQLFRLRDLQLFIFFHKMKPASGFAPEMQDFMPRRQALIESGRPSVEIDWSAVDLPVPG